MEKLKDDFGFDFDFNLIDDTLITNFNINDLELYKIAIILYKDTKVQGLCIKKEAYDTFGGILPHHMSLHKMNKKIGYLSEFWKIYEKILVTPIEQRKKLLREFKLKRIVEC